MRKILFGNKLYNEDIEIKEYAEVLHETVFNSDLDSSKIKSRLHDIEDQFEYIKSISSDYLKINHKHILYNEFLKYTYCTWGEHICKTKDLEIDKCYKLNGIEDYPYKRLEVSNNFFEMNGIDGLGFETNVKIYKAIEDEAENTEDTFLTEETTIESGHTSYKVVFYSDLEDWIIRRSYAYDLKKSKDALNNVMNFKFEM